MKIPTSPGSHRNCEETFGIVGGGSKPKVLSLDLKATQILCLNPAKVCGL